MRVSNQVQYSVQAFDHSLAHLLLLYHPFPLKTLNHPPRSNPQELSMPTATAMDVSPISTTHLDLEHLPLDDKYFQIKDTTTLEPLLKVHCQCRDRSLKHADEIGLWESNFSKYKFPQFPNFP